MNASQASLLSIVILTQNEALHIKRCIESAKQLTPHIFVIDSESMDNTATIARESGAYVISGTFSKFADKLNWVLDNVQFPTSWIFRLDADEVLTEGLVNELPGIIVSAPPDVSGFYLRRQIWFMGQWIRHGDMYPTYSMRVWRQRSVVCEARDLDEHMLLRYGVAIRADVDIIDDPLFSLSHWIEKHNHYSSSEATAALSLDRGSSQLITPNLFGTWAQRKRWLKTRIFYRLPPFIRPLLYFFYRYFFRLGFLDGRIGFIFHFMHGLWYRCLVDAKIIEKYREDIATRCKRNSKL